MNLERVIEALAPTDVVQRAPVEISDLAYDTRAVQPGALFFCVPGERHDGHAFARDAVQRGAVALVVERPLGLDVVQLVVPDARIAMAQAGVAFFDDPTKELEVAGVTGTNGKTTTTFLLHSILGAAGRRPGLLGTVESRVGDARRPAIRTAPAAIDLQRARREMLDAGNRSRALEAPAPGPARGRPNVETAVAAVAASRLLAIENEAIADGVAALAGVPGRFEAVDAGQAFAVVVDYSHKPEALENVLRTAREIAANRVICVFGC